MDDTVQIVEKNPAKFRIDSSELLVRKAFIQQTRDEVNQMKDRVSNGTSAATNITNRINIEVRWNIYMHNDRIILFLSTALLIMKLFVFFSS